MGDRKQQPLRGLRGQDSRAPEHGARAEGLAVARRIAGATSQLRLAATAGYAQAIEDELRERYRAIRHDLRTLLGTIRSAVVLLTDESVPAEVRESPRVRALVVRNTSSLDQLIGEALGDAAARLRAFDTSHRGKRRQPRRQPR
jgi:K+-sensing histidine kinase KdpD